MRTKKAQMGPIGAIFLFIFFIINWFIWLGSWLAEVGQNAIETGGLIGVDAFMLSNLNFVVFICMLLGMMGWMYFAGE